MADIFLSYGGAQRLVETFEKSLSRQGHIVYSDADFDYRSDAIIAKLRQFDAIIVIWSENSKSRDLTLAVAAEALPIGTAHSDACTRFVRPPYAKTQMRHSQNPVSGGVRSSAYTYSLDVTLTSATSLP